MRARTALLTFASVAALGCGDDEPSPEDQVRDVVTRFGEASAKKDYALMCSELLSPALVDNVEQYGLPCEAALRRGLGEVKSPKLVIEELTVDGDEAEVRVTTTAQGQQPSEDALGLLRVSDEWRIAQLGDARPPAN